MQLHNYIFFIIILWYHHHANFCVCSKRCVQGIQKVRLGLNTSQTTQWGKRSRKTWCKYIVKGKLHRWWTIVCFISLNHLINPIVNVLYKFVICFPFIYKWYMYAFLNFCMQISCPLTYCVNCISSKGSVTADHDSHSKSLQTLFQWQCEHGRGEFPLTYCC